MHGGSDRSKGAAAGALGILAHNNEVNQVAIAQVDGALTALVALLYEMSDASMENAAYALVNLAFNNEVNQVAIAQVDGTLAALVLGANAQRERGGQGGYGGARS